ncbi:PAS domain-containing protein [Chitiniphilus purpureus]|uniref:PAS domain-containing protein n=1 Tax=Chitiniphilus purpureus TaxID=2981137 RepID=A0ABY6DJL1_9NEIS|nr:PAS domain-containing protein [Chitiniphilus sp. CD1]UXY14418.1 PAS domain-containing protein [Chitiniphilus sp. CD1]
MTTKSQTSRFELAVLGLALLACLFALVAMQWWAADRLGGKIWFLYGLFTITAVGLLLLLLRRPVLQSTPDAREALPAVERQAIAHCLPDIVWRIDYATRAVTPLNKVDNSDHPNAQDDNARLSMLFPARVSRQYLEALISVQSAQTPQQFEYRLAQAEGKAQRVFEARLLPLSGKDCLAVIRDITEMKATEEALFNQQLFVHQIIDSSPSLIFVRDRHGRFLLVNRATQSALGHDLLVQSHMGLADQQLPFTVGDQDVLEKGETVRIVDHCTLANGRTHWFDLIKQPLIRDGEVYILSIAMDISHVKAAEAALANSEPLSGEVADALPQPFMLIREGNIEFANLAACLLLNAPPSAVLGRPLSAFAGNAEALLGVADFEAQRFELANGGHYDCWARRIRQSAGEAQLIVFDTSRETQPA